MSAVSVALVEPSLRVGVRELAGSSGRHCHGVAPFSGRGWLTVAQEPPPSV